MAAIKNNETKRITFDIDAEYYNMELKPAADSLGVPIDDFIKQAIDDRLDDLFCEKMYQDYLNDPDPNKDDGIDLEDLAVELGIEL